MAFAGLRRYQAGPGRGGADRRRSRSPAPLSPVALSPGLGSADGATEAPSAPAEDDALPFALCVLSVAVALGAILLIPLTMLDQLMSAVLVAAPDLYGGLGDTNVGALWELVGIPAPSY